MLADARLMRPGCAARSQVELERRITLGPRHPHLVRGYAAFDESGSACLVMEHCDGGSVAAWHARRRCAPAQLGACCSRRMRCSLSRA